MEILKIASSQIGEKEIPGSEHNDQIISYAKETGISGISNDEIPWCSTFVNWCAMKANLPYSKKPNARSWINIGTTTTDPKPGDIVVFWRDSIQSWKGHVAIFLGFNNDKTKIFCLGGNQNNEVNISEYDSNRVLSFRTLETNQSLSIPDPSIKLNDRGLKVTQLQKILTFLEYPCGPIDGVFGKKTEQSLKLFQSNNSIEINGIYDAIVKNTFTTLLQT